MIRMRRKTPFQGLRMYFGVSTQSAQNYYFECLDVFHANVVPRLVHPLMASQIRDMTPPDFARDLPNCLVIFDLKGFEKLGKENVLLSRLLWSAYHHRSEAGVLFGMYLVTFAADLSDSFCFFRLHAKWFIHFSIKTFWRDF